MRKIRSLVLMRSACRLRFAHETTWCWYIAMRCWTVDMRVDGGGISSGVLILGIWLDERL